MQLERQLKTVGSELASRAVESVRTELVSVERVDGNYTNVVGLPIPLTRALFRALDFDLRNFRRADRS